MKRKIIYIITAIALVLSMTLTSCGAAAGSEETVQETAQTFTAEALSKADMFTERDLSGEYDEAEALKISLDGASASITAEGTETTSAGVSIDGSVITITAEGTYILSGTLNDGQIIVDADDSAKVQIVLDGASITSSSSAALYVKSADKVFVTTAAGTDNTLANGGSYDDTDGSGADGTVYAKDDITFNGSGTLTVTSPAGHGIVGNDDVRIAGGTVTVTAAKHGIKAHDSVRIAEASVTVSAGKDGVHVSDSSDEENGEESDSFFYMADGSLTIAAGDDGIHADAAAVIEGGSVDVTQSYEGIEALAISVSGGDIKVTASDDGLNASGGKSSGSSAEGSGQNAGSPGDVFTEGGTDGSIVISGGSIYITAGGDAIDSNGSVEISGGYTVTEGPSAGDTSVLDYNSTAVITGGTFIGTGGAGMAENFSSASQGLIAVSVGEQQAGSTVVLKDASGNVIAEVSPDLGYSVVYISAESMAQGGTYTLTAGSYSESITLSDMMYSTLAGGMGGSFGGGGPRGGMNDNSGGAPGEFPGEPQNGLPEGTQNGMPGGAQGQFRGGAPDGMPDGVTGATQQSDAGL